MKRYHYLNHQHLELSLKNSSTIENFSIKFPKPQSLSASNKDKSAKVNTHPPMPRVS